MTTAENLACIKQTLLTEKQKYANTVAQLLQCALQCIKEEIQKNFEEFQINLELTFEYNDEGGSDLHVVVTGNSADAKKFSASKYYSKEGYSSSWYVELTSIQKQNFMTEDELTDRLSKVDELEQEYINALEFEIDEYIKSAITA